MTMHQVLEQVLRPRRLAAYLDELAQDARAPGTRERQRAFFRAQANREATRGCQCGPCRRARRLAFPPMAASPPGV